MTYVSNVVSKYCVNLIFQVRLRYQPEVLKELAIATELLGDEAMAIRFISMFLCAQFVRNLYSIAFLHLILLEETFLLLYWN